MRMRTRTRRAGAGAGEGGRGGDAKGGDETCHVRAGGLKGEEDERITEPAHIIRTFSLLQFNETVRNGEEYISRPPVHR